MELEVPVRLGELQAGELDQKLADGKVKFWQNGVEVPVTAVPEGTITAETLATLDEDGTLHILITPEISGTQEAIDTSSPLADEVDQLGVTVAGMWAGVLPTTTMDMVDSAIGRLDSYQKTLDYSAWDKFWASVFGESTDLSTLDTSMKLDFSAETVAELSAYVAEMVSAIQQGQAVSETDMANLQSIVTFLNGLDVTGTGAHVREGIAQGMTDAGWATDAETVASNLETALNQALGIQSPSTRVKPVGDNVSAGIGVGMTEHDFATDAATTATNVTTAVNTALTTETLKASGTTAATGLASGMTGYSMSSSGSTVASNVKSAVSTSLTSTTLRSVGVNAMGGLKAGINAGTAGVVAAMRAAAQSAVAAAKKQLKIASPSGVFRDEVGRMTMKGFGQGVLLESRQQAKIVQNAARYLTGEAKSGSISTTSNDNRRTYNQSSNVNLSGNTFYVRDEQDIKSLAIEIAALTKRRQRGRGLRMA